MSGTEIDLTGLAKKYEGTAGPAAVDGVDARISAGSMTAVLGPSGCGKSTLLAMVGGLLQPDAGDVLFDGRSVLTVPAERRSVGLVFQRPLLFPHLSVAQNVAFGLRMRGGLDRSTIRRRVGAMLDRVQLGALGNRRVGELSGGQEQRASLARALVLEPRVLLLDEPFSQLDAALRAEMRTLVVGLQAESKVTTLFVTHDQSEAVEVADSILLMLAGRVEGHGPPDLFYRRPPTLAAARFFGPVNEFPGAVSAGVFTADASGVPVVPVAGVPGGAAVPVGPAVLVVRPESMRFDPTSPLSGLVRQVRFAGTHLWVDLESGARDILIQTPVTNAVPVGATVGVDFDPAEATLVAGRSDRPAAGVRSGPA